MGSERESGEVFRDFLDIDRLHQALSFSLKDWNEILEQYEIHLLEKDPKGDILRIGLVWNMDSNRDASLEFVKGDKGIIEVSFHIPGRKSEDPLEDSEDSSKNLESEDFRSDADLGSICGLELARYASGPHLYLKLEDGMIEIGPRGVKFDASAVVSVFSRINEETLPQEPSPDYHQ